MTSKRGQVGWTFFKDAAMAKESVQGVLNIFIAGVADVTPHPSSESVDHARHALPPMGDEGTAVISTYLEDRIVDLEKEAQANQEKYDEP